MIFFAIFLQPVSSQKLLLFKRILQHRQVYEQITHVYMWLTLPPIVPLHVVNNWLMNFFWKADLCFNSVNLLLWHFFSEFLPEHFKLTLSIPERETSTLKDNTHYTMNILSRLELTCRLLRMSVCYSDKWYEADRKWKDVLLMKPTQSWLLLPQLL